MPGFTVRRLMLGVAILAVPLALAAEMGRRKAEYRGRVAYHADRGQIPGGVVYSGVFHYRDSATGKMARKSWAEIHYRAEMVEKYRYAAEHPWLPVAPDPPVPEY